MEGIFCETEGPEEGQGTRFKMNFMQLTQTRLTAIRHKRDVILLY